MEYIGQHVSEGAEAISKKLGIPAADIENMIGTLTMAGAPKAAKVGGAVKKGVFAADQALVNEAKMIGGAIKEKLPTVKVEMQKQFDAKKAPELTQNIEQLQHPLYPMLPKLLLRGFLHLVTLRYKIHR
jgi:hypothetical protein